MFRLFNPIIYNVINDIHFQLYDYFSLQFIIIIAFNDKEK